jgi:hypothetical protein
MLRVERHFCSCIRGSDLPTGELAESGRLFPKSIPVAASKS